MKKTLLIMVVILLYCGVAVAGAVIYYGYPTDTPGCDYRIRAILKDADLVDEPEGYSATYHINSSTENLPLIKDIKLNTECVFYYDTAPSCNGKPLYCLSTEDGFLLTPTLVYTGTNQSILEMYGVSQ